MCIMYDSEAAIAIKDDDAPSVGAPIPEDLASLVCELKLSSIITS